MTPGGCAPTVTGGVAPVAGEAGDLEREETGIRDISRAGAALDGGYAPQEVPTDG